MTSPHGDAVMVYLLDPQSWTLMVRPRGLLEGWWMPPGGHIDPGETPAMAGCRELAEELHITCSLEDLRQLGGCPKDLGTGSLTLFDAHIAREDHLALGPEILEARWFPLAACSDLPMLPATCFGLRLIDNRATPGGGSP